MSICDGCGVEYRKGAGIEVMQGCKRYLYCPDCVGRGVWLTQPEKP